MQRKHWSRLETLEQAVDPDVQRVCVFRYVGETTEDVDRKVEAWKAGGELDGPTDTPYLGGDLTVAIIRFVTSSTSEASQ